jgi:hypothetical protein
MLGPSITSRPPSSIIVLKFTQLVHSHCCSFCFCRHQQNATNRIISIENACFIFLVGGFVLVGIVQVQYSVVANQEASFVIMTFLISAGVLVTRSTQNTERINQNPLLTVMSLSHYCTVIGYHGFVDTKVSFFSLLVQSTQESY